MPACLEMKKGGKKEEDMKDETETDENVSGAGATSEGSRDDFKANECRGGKSERKMKNELNQSTSNRKSPSKPQTPKKRQRSDSSPDSPSTSNQSSSYKDDKSAGSFS